MTRSYQLRLVDMLDAVQGIKKTVQGLTFEEYQKNWQARRAIERGIEIISEASRHIPDSIKQKYPAIPWMDVAAIGNKLRHEYQRIEDRIIWNAASDRLDQLEAFCMHELGS